MLDVPEVKVEHIVAVSSSKLYINWTVTDWNSPVTGYILSFREGDTNQWKYHIDTQIDSYSTSYLMADLKKEQERKVRLEQILAQKAALVEENNQLMRQTTQQEAAAPAVAAVSAPAPAPATVSLVPSKPSPGKLASFGERAACARALTLGPCTKRARGRAPLARRARRTT